MITLKITLNKIQVGLKWNMIFIGIFCSKLQNYFLHLLACVGGVFFYALSFVLRNEIQPCKRWTVDYEHTIRQRTEITHETPNHSQLLFLVVCTIIFSIFRNFPHSEVASLPHGVDMQATCQVFTWITFIHLFEYVLKDLFTLAQARYQVVYSYFEKGCHKKCASNDPERYI